MSKFKVGDEVRRINYNHGSLKLGQVGRVRNTDSTGVQIVGECDDFWHQDENLELVSEGPVRTVTRREVFEGKYGIVRVDRHRDQIVVTISPEDGHQPTGDDLRSATMVLSQLAEWRDEVTK